MTSEQVPNKDPLARYGFSPAIEVGAAINSLMWVKRITQTELGAAIGVSQSTMAKKLRGTVGITINELYAICVALGVEPSELLPIEPYLRACRDSNPKPSVLEPRLTLVQGWKPAHRRDMGRTLTERLRAV